MKYPLFYVGVLSGALLWAIGTFQPAQGQGISLEKKVEPQNPFSATAEKPPEPKPFEESMLSLPPPPIPPLLTPGKTPVARKPVEISSSRNSSPAAESPAVKGSSPEVASPVAEQPSKEIVEAPRTVTPCPILIESGERYDVPSVGGQMIVRVSLVGDRSCVLAVESKVAWISVNAFDGKTLILDFQANARRRDRSGAVVLANAQFSKNLQVYQAPCVDPNCEGTLTTPVEPAVDAASKAPNPKGDSIESR